MAAALGGPGSLLSIAAEPLDRLAPPDHVAPRDRLVMQGHLEQSNRMGPQARLVAPVSPQSSTADTHERLQLQFQESTSRKWARRGPQSSNSRPPGRANTGDGNPQHANARGPRLIDHLGRRLTLVGRAGCTYTEHRQVTVVGSEAARGNHGVECGLCFVSSDRE